ncbi:hypothetical protein AB833_31795 [Chromatiales bacterium (ex Bugula neritina AB1)]|nr:hypothetical protein AB833_31795 [Chromatiales bacterium (ex Bugula neritina AB1)]
MIATAGLLALLCLAASGLLDLVFKLYTRQKHSIGLLVFGVGSVWFILHGTYVYATGSVLAFDPLTWRYGLLAAVAVTASNIVLLECLSRMPISTASTIYRLNTIPLVLLAMLFLGEQLSPVKGAGILVGLVTVLLLYQSAAISEFSRSQSMRYLALIIMAACIRALYGIFTKAGIASGADANSMMLLASIGWISGGFLYAGLREKTVQIMPGMMRYIVTAGVLVFAVVWLLTTALTFGDASVVIPIANMGFIAAFLFSLVLRLEVLTPRKLLAVLSAVVSIVLLTSTV